MLPVPHLSPFPAAIPFLTEEQTSGFEGFGNPETAAGCEGGRFSGLAGAGQVILRGVWARPLALKPRVSSGLAGCSEVSGRERLAKVAERHTRAYPPVYKVIPQVFDKPFLPI